MAFAPAISEPLSIASADVDLVELYFDRGWTDGLPVVAPTHDKVDAVVRALGGNPGFVECKVAPRWGALSREVLAINVVMAGCKPEYAPVVRAALLALEGLAFHDYGKEARPGRKLGHCTILRQRAQDRDRALRRVLKLIRWS